MKYNRKYCGDLMTLVKISSVFVVYRTHNHTLFTLSMCFVFLVNLYLTFVTF